MTCERVCVLLDDEYLPAFQATAIEEMTARTGAEITLVVINDDSRSLLDRSPSYALDRFRRWLPWLPIWATSQLSRALRGPPDYDESRHVSTVDAFDEAAVVRCSPDSANGSWVTLPDFHVDRIAAEADVVLRFGFGLISGRILRSPEYGVLSFHLSDIREYRGWMGAFWEFIDGRDSVGVTLQRLTEQIDAGQIVAFDRVEIDESETFGTIKRRQRVDVMPDVLVEGIRNLNDPNFEPAVPESLGTYHSIPGFLAVAKYLWKNNRIRIENRFPGTGGSTDASQSTTADLSNE